MLGIACNIGDNAEEVMCLARPGQLRPGFVPRPSRTSVTWASPPGLLN
jgi:hypothetical protein